MDEAVADIFGYHAVQLGMPRIDGLRTNRMPHQWLALGADALLNEPGDWGGPIPPDAPRAVALWAEPVALPFPSASLDLVVLPHTLELSEDPHMALREVERVLVPEGSVVISGFNPFSLWGVRRLVARRAAAVPWSGHFRSAMRIRDWLTLLGFEVQGNAFGAYAPPVGSPRWLERWRFMDRAGPRWWPVLGAGYLLHGVKRVHGMRLITPQWRGTKATAKRLSPIAQRAGGTRTTQ